MSSCLFVVAILAPHFVWAIYNKIKIITIFLFIVFVNQAASSLNSSYCYILQSESVVFTWYGNLTNSDDQELAERMLDLIKVCMFQDTYM